jgi:hypothetical protein
MCYAEMTLVTVTPDDTMPVAGFEHHTFMCSGCGDIEHRLTFTKPTRDRSSGPARATIVPDDITSEERDALLGGPRHPDPGRFREVLARILGRPH